MEAKTEAQKAEEWWARVATLPVEKPIGRQYRETQSEIADYGFGRRSCDTDPRFSLDAGRISFEDPRYSFDEPRASWDGYLIGRTFPRMPTMVSFWVEDAPVNVVLRSDTQIPVEEPQPITMNSIHEDETVPGGSAQTRDYYSDSSSRRRRSLDRSNSIRKTAAAVVAEIDELKSASASNAKVSPANVDYFHGPKVVVPDRDSNSNSLRDDCSETFEMGFGDQASIVGNGKGRGPRSPGDGVRPGTFGGLYTGEVSTKMRTRIVLVGDSNGLGGGSFGSARKSSVETNGHGRKKRDEFVLERIEVQVEVFLLRGSVVSLTLLRDHEVGLVLCVAREDHLHLSLGDFYCLTWGIGNNRDVCESPGSVTGEKKKMIMKSSNPCDLSKFVRSESQQLLNLTNGRRCAICWYKELRQKHANSQPGAYVAQAPETPMDVDVLNPSTSITAEPNANIPSIIQQELAKYMKGKMIMDLLLLLISLIS
ncbi:hypothetical protein GH714_016844 [Hevea brasiliensis]|uniref:Uncharacterized protein n=1 Tax=Hevea brasiliensis TaxID=3981 RepID=A0A6A6M1V0_HEVBR|nr:hypothetical protein GH714_016844 [Hevea brasiliensis]